MYCLYDFVSEMNMEEWKCDLCLSMEFIWLNLIF